MRKTMAPTGSVHFIDSETISKQIFAPARYNLPLFLCKKLNVRSTSAERNTKQQCQRKLDKTSLLQRMSKYHVNELAKVPHQLNKKSSQISQPQPQTIVAAPGRRRCNTHRSRWPDCARPLRDGRKEWSLPPGRYRLGGSLADLAHRRSTGTERRESDPTKGGSHAVRAVLRAPSASLSGSKSNGITTKCHLVDISTINLPTEMNKLLHPRKYFVGKIRPGDRLKDRPTLRLAITELTVCYRDPNHPGPGRYDPENVQPCQSRTHEGANKKSSCCYSYDLYCREPFFRPPPGRYNIHNALPPIPSGQSRQRSERMLKPIPPIRYGKVTIRLNSIDIPVRPRKGRRNMKVAFLSGSARFRDRDFFPIGGLGKATTEQQGRKAKASTSKKLFHVSPQLVQTSSPPPDGRSAEERESPEVSRTSVIPRSSQADEQPEGLENVVGKVEKQRVSEDLVQLLVGYGISRGDLPALAKHKIATKFFTVPKLARTELVAMF